MTTPRKYTAADKAKVLQLADQGISRQRIAAMTGFGAGFVERTVYKAGKRFTGQAFGGKPIKEPPPKDLSHIWSTLLSRRWFDMPHHL